MSHIVAIIDLQATFSDPQERLQRYRSLLTGAPVLAQGEMPVHKVVVPTSCSETLIMVVLFKHPFPLSKTLNQYLKLWVMNRGNEKDQD